MRTTRRTRVYPLLMVLAAWSGLACTTVQSDSESKAPAAATQNLLLEGGEATGLGAPSISIASGSGMVAAGVGMETSPGVINLNVPGTVQQALLYWAGEHSIGAGDDTIDVDFSGNPQVIVGTLIGGPEFFFNNNGDVFVSTYRADVTPFISAGGNVLTITGMDFDVESLGAGLLVIYDDGTSAAIEIRDGQDLAFALFAPPLDATVPQTFAIAPAGADRSAELLIFAGDVEVGRPNRIRIDVPGAGTTDIDNLLNSTDGPDWDTHTIAVNVPAGADSITVEAISLDDGSGVLPASLAWITAGLTIVEPECGDGVVDPGEECDDANTNDFDECRNDCTAPECGDGITDPGEECDDANTNNFDECRNDCTLPECGDGVVDPGEECDDANTNDFDECRNDCTAPECGDGVLDPGEECDDGNHDAGDGCSPECTIERVGGEGCTPGYWKQEHHFDSWVGYTPDQMFDVVFGVDAPGDKTLVETMWTGGGKQHALGRHAVAALLNAASSVGYAYTEAEVIALVQDAYATGDFNGIKDMLADENESGCPLN